jgi:hypothetical protein
MLLKGAVRRRQVSKKPCLTERCHGDSQEACIVLRVRREALWRNVVTTLGYYRYPLSRWGSASWATPWCEEHPPERHTEAKASTQEGVLD